MLFSVTTLWAVSTLSGIYPFVLEGSRIVQKISTHTNLPHIPFQNKVAIYGNEAVFKGTNEKIEGYVVRNGRLLTIALPGSHTLNDWEINMNCKGEFYSYLNGKVHAGYLNKMDVLLARIEYILRKISDKDIELLLAGHSAGGALSMLLAYELKRRLNVPVTNLTFGAPRIFNKEAAEEFATSIGKKYFYRCFINGTFIKDPIPYLPPFLQHPKYGKIPISNFGHIINPHPMASYNFLIETPECKKYIENLF